MALDPESVGTHAGATFIGGLLAALGFKKYIEKRLDRVDDDIESLRKSVVFDDTCGMCRVNSTNQIQSVHDSVEKLEKTTNEKLDLLIVLSKRHRENDTD